MRASANRPIMTRRRLLSVSEVLAAILVLQWTIGLAACVASLSAGVNPGTVLCHAPGGATVPSQAPMDHGPDQAACPICAQLTATVLPAPPAIAIRPRPTGAVLPPFSLWDAWVPATTNAAHPPTGPPHLA